MACGRIMSCRTKWCFSNARVFFGMRLVRTAPDTQGDDNRGVAVLHPFGVDRIGDHRSEPLDCGTRMTKMGRLRGNHGS